MGSTAPQIRTMTTDEVRNLSVDFSALLDDGELLTGTPDIQCSDELTITNAQVNASAVDINGASAGAGTAIQFTVAPSVAGSYRIEVVCDTDAGQTLEGIVNVRIDRTKF